MFRRRPLIVRRRILRRRMFGCGPLFLLLMLGLIFMMGVILPAL